MARLDLHAAPPASVPRAFLMSVPAWGMAAGTLVAVEGGAMFASRWSGPTLALVHALTLGVLGNAMVGALFQFLPAAAGVRPWRPVLCGRSVHGLLNAGAAALVVGFHGFRPAWLEAGAALLAAAFALTGACTLPALLHARGDRVLHAGIAGALVALLVTAGLGLAMVGGLTGSWRGLAPVRWADVHAVWGLLGWATVLLAAVAQTVVPMFHGAAAMRARAHAGWMLACGLVLMASVAAPGGVLRAGVSACVATWAASTAVRLWRARRHRRNPTLVCSWQGSALALAALALGLALGAPAPWLGTLALGLAAPLFVLPMLLEITAFLGWLDLQRTMPRRSRIPSIGVVQPERAKAGVMLLHGGAGLVLVACALGPSDALARSGGMLLVAAHAALAIALGAALARERRFVQRGVL